METAPQTQSADTDCELCRQISYSSTPSVPINPSGKATGLVLAGVFGGSALILSAICFPFVAPALRRICLPYVPASEQQVRNVVQALTLHSKPGGCLVDLGSGDGRIVLAAAQNGYKSHGVELNGVLVWYSKYAAWRQGLKTATFSKQDLFKLDYTQYNNVIIFGVDEMMPELEQLFQNSLVSQSKVVACRFPLPNWTPVVVIGEGIDRVWVYEKS